MISGALIGRRITPTELPQTVAALHSVVGLAAVLTSIGSALSHVEDLTTLHMVTAYLGVVIGKAFTYHSDLRNTSNFLIFPGGITFTGSIVAFMKLAGRMSSRPLALPGKHIINSALLAANAGTMGAFVTMAPGAPVVAAMALSASTVLSFAKGYTTTAAIGGADMRRSSLPCPLSANANVLDSGGHYCSERIFRIRARRRRIHA